MNKEKANSTPKNNKKRFLFPILIAFAIAISFIGGYFSRYIIDGRSVSVINDVVRIIEKHGYVFDDSTGELRQLSESDYADLLVNGLLDRYSEYYTPEEYQEVIKNRSGNRSGVGISNVSGTNVIYKVMGNSPADRQGLKSGDKITAGKIDQGEFRNINDSEDLNNFFDDCTSQSVITLKIDRDGEFSGREITLQQEDYVTSYVTYYDSEKKMCYRTQDGQMVKHQTNDGMAELNDDVAYIKFDLFEGGAVWQLRQALEFMRERGRTKLIFDLRDNGGGYVDVMLGIASLLIDKEGESNLLISVAESKTGTQEFFARANGFNQNVLAISVIANRNSASASESLIGAMLHYGYRFSIDRLVIEKNSLGQAKTYGKGIMQTTYSLITGGAFKLTTARILWPDKTTCIHEKGIYATEQNATEKGVSAILRAQETLYE